MNTVRSLPDPFARSASSVLDAAGLALLALLFYRIAFSGLRWYDALGAAVAVAGLLAAVAAGHVSSLRTRVAVPIAVYVALSLVSAAVNYHRYPPSLPGDGGVAALWQSPVHTVVLAAYFFGLLWLLRTNRRMGVCVLLFVAVVSGFGMSTSLEMLSRGFKDRYAEFARLVHWSGYAPLAFLYSLAFAFPFALAFAGRSVRQRVAGLAIAGIIALNLVLMTSKSAFVALAAVIVTLIVVEIRSLKRSHVILLAVVAVAVAFGARQMASETMSGLVFELKGVSYDSRAAIWMRTTRLIRDHALTGVGVGNYMETMRAGYVRGPEPYDAHAHNMLLHVAAERGVPAALAFAAIWFSVLGGLWSACRARTSGRLIALGTLAALAAFFVRGLSDQFLSVFVVSNKLDYLLWTLFAMGVAVARLTEPSPDVSRGASS